MGSGFDVLGGLIGGAFRGGRDTNAGGSIYGGQRTMLKDALEGAGSAGDEQFANDAQKAQSLRKLFALYGTEMGKPELKEQSQTMSLGELEGGLRGFVLDQERQRQKQAQDYQSAIMEQMKAAQAQKQRETEATSAFGRAVTEPAARERWGSALAQGPTMAGADMLNQPLRAPTAPEVSGALLRAARTGAIPDDVTRAAGAFGRLLPESQTPDPMRQRDQELRSRELDIRERQFGQSKGTAAAQVGRLTDVQKMILAPYQASIVAAQKQVALAQSKRGDNDLGGTAEKAFHDANVELSMAQKRFANELARMGGGQASPSGPVIRYDMSDLMQ